MNKQAMALVMNNVIDFHREHGVPMRATPGVPHADEVKLMARLIVEEVGELLAALFDEFFQNGDDNSIAYTIDRLQAMIDEAPVAVDLVEAADALADIQYVTIGAALRCGIPFDAVWEEVCRSNASKAGAIKRADGKIEKPPTYSPPDIERILFPVARVFAPVFAEKPTAMIPQTPEPGDAA